MLNPNLYSFASVEDSIFNLLLDGSMKAVALASQPLGK